MCGAMGRGVVTKKNIAAGDFVLEYRGELISHKEGLQREKTYSERTSFLYFFWFHGRRKWLVCKEDRWCDNIAFK